MSVEEVVGSLKAHEEILKGKSENSGGQLMLIKEEWTKWDNGEGKLLLMREEWVKRNKGNAEGSNM